MNPTTLDQVLPQHCKECPYRYALMISLLRAKLAELDDTTQVTAATMKKWMDEVGEASAQSDRQSE